MRVHRRRRGLVPVDIDFDAPISDRVVRKSSGLRFLDEHRVKATFFVQGRVAETFPIC